MKDYISVHCLVFINKQYPNDVDQHCIISCTIYIKMGYWVKCLKWYDKADFAYVWKKTLIDWEAI